jgi:hypothetical protein
MGQTVHGVELSVVRAVHGASSPWRSCPWGELSMDLYVMGRYVMGRVVSGRVPMGRVVREPFFHHDTSSIIHYLELPGFYIYLFTKNCGVASVTFT